MMYGNYNSLWLRTCGNVFIICVILCNSSVLSQPLNSNSERGVPLPVLQEGHRQGEASVAVSGHRMPRPVDSEGQALPPLPPPSTSKYREVKGGSNPVFDFKLRDNVAASKVNLGPGSLHHIREPTQDTNVKLLLQHPDVLKSIEQEILADSAVKVDSVVAAYKQVVSGLITYLDLKVIETKCSVGSRDVKGCDIDIDDNPYICEVAVWQRPWLNSTKIIKEKTRCAEVENENEFKNWNKGNGGLRSLSSEVPLPSLPSFLDEHQVALEAFEYLDRGSESKFKGQMIDYKIQDIKHDPTRNTTLAMVNLEYGFTLCLRFPNRKIDDRICPLDTKRDNYICEITVVSDPNLTSNLKVLPNDDDDVKCMKKAPANEEFIVPIEAVCMGCPKTASLNDPSILKIAQFAVIEYDLSSDEDELHTLVKLHKAQTQVINGIKYILTLELVKTDCHKPLSAINMNRTLCSVKLEEEPDICDIVVLEQPWQNSLELIYARCFDKSEYASQSHDEFIVPAVTHQVGSGRMAPLRSEAVGKEFPSDISIRNDYPSQLIHALPLDTQNSVRFVLHEINRREVDDLDDGLFKILNVYKAVTLNEPIGQIDLIVVEIGETVCHGKELTDNCPLKPDEEPEICTAKVLKGLDRQLLLLKCDDEIDQHLYLALNPSVSRYKKTQRPFFSAPLTSGGLPGEAVEQPANSSDVKQIADFIVDQYNLQSDDDELHKLGTVLHAYSQLTGVAKYILELELLETKCKKYQPVMNVSMCPVDTQEKPEICQAEVTFTFPSGFLEGPKHLNKIFCDDREDYYINKMKLEGSIPEGEWKIEESNSSKVETLGKHIADEFDARSDDENIYVLFSVLESKSKSPGLTYYLKVELAETVCPKYKLRINKTRCIIDIGEEHKICEALITERPWRNNYEVLKLTCFERDNSRENDESREVLYPDVHPTAHARPKFIASRYKIRQHSIESDESNEKYYITSRQLSQQSDHVVDSDEGFVHPDKFEEHFQNLRSQRQFDADDENERDSDRTLDIDSRSSERVGHDRIRRRTEKRRGGQNTLSFVGGASPVSVNDSEVQKLATFSLGQMDQWSEDPRLRTVTKVLKATSQVVAGVLWRIRALVSYTLCQKSDGQQQDISACALDPDETSSICDIAIWEKPWENFRNTTEFSCSPVNNCTFC